MIFYSLLTLSAFMISLVGTRLTIQALRDRTHPLDGLAVRGSHRARAPRGGGFPVVIALVIGLLVADVDYTVVLSLFALAAVSLLDDLVGVPRPVQLLTQGLAVFITLGMMPLLFGGVLPPWLDRLLVAVLWVWFINLFDVMDGIDGISAAEMISIALGFCLVTVIGGAFPNHLSIYSMVVAAAGAGFLWWNWHPARIFLGHVGSVPIGFILGYLLLLALQSGYLSAALILPAYYLADGSITLLCRLWKRKKVWVRHSEYYFQYAIRNGRRHSTVVRYILGVNLLLALLATFSVTDPDPGYLYIALAYMTVFMMLGFFAHTPHNPDHEPF